MNNLSDKVLTILGKYKIKMGEHKMTEGINILKLKNIVNSITDDIELSGVYDPIFQNFKIDPRASRYDTRSGRAFSLLDPIRNHIVWHSHPSYNDELSFPSIEDLDCVRLNPQTVFILIVKDGVYVMCSKREIVSIDHVTSFYRSLQSDKCGKWNFKEIQSSFQTGNYTSDVFRIKYIDWESINGLDKIIKNFYDNKVVKN